MTHKKEESFEVRKKIFFKMSTTRDFFRFAEFLKKSVFL